MSESNCPPLPKGLTQEWKVELTDKQLAPALASIRDASGKTPETVEQINVLLRKLSLSAGASLAKLDRAMGDLRQVTSNLRELTDRASRYPAHTLFGEPPPRALKTKGK